MIFKIPFLFILILITQNSCRKSDEQLKEKIIGTWEGSLVGNPYIDPIQMRIIFEKNNEYSTYANWNGGWTITSENLKFEISKGNLLLQDSTNNFTSYKIIKLSKKELIYSSPSIEGNYNFTRIK